MLASQGAFDPGLAFQQPVEHGQDLIAGDLTETEQSAETGVRGGGRQQAGRGELGDRQQDAGDESSQGQSADTGVAAVQAAFEAELAQRAEDSGDMTVGQAALDTEGGVEAGQGTAASQQDAQAMDEFVGERGEVGESLFTDAMAVAPSAAQQDGRRAVAVGDSLDVQRHGNTKGGSNLYMIPL